MSSVQNEHRDDGYFEWLVERSGCDQHIELLDMLFHTPFRSTIPMDENRAEDGLYLRTLYRNETGMTPKRAERVCTVLEFFIAFAERLDEGTSYQHDAMYWFAYFLDVIGIYHYDDDAFLDGDPFEIELDIDDRLNVLMDHQYDWDGSHGGLFHVNCPPYDMRTVELWFQMQYWLVENYM